MVLPAPQLLQSDLDSFYHAAFGTTGIRFRMSPRCMALERRLRAEARIGVRIDRALGRAIDLLRRRKLYQELSFVRFSDYIRETVGLSCRTAQEMIRTERALDQLPEIAAAWDLGILHTAQVRLLCGVANPSTERQWIEKASDLSVRSLAEEIRRGAAAQNEENQEGRSADDVNLIVTSGQASVIHRQRRQLEQTLEGRETIQSQECGLVRADGQAAEPHSQGRSAGGEEQDPQKISFKAPIAFALRWRVALELCAAVSGADLPEWALVENLCAEVRSGLPLPSDDEREDQTGEADGIESVPGVSTSEPDEAARIVSNDSGDEAENADELDQWTEMDVRKDPGPAQNLGQRQVPPSLEQFLRDEAPEDPWELHERIGALAEMRHRIEAGLSKRLFEFVTIGGTLEARFRSLRQYACEVLGMSERRVRYLFHLERRLLGFPFVSQAYRRGDLSWLQCSYLLRVVRGETSERAWIAFAREVTVLRLKEAVEAERLRILALTAEGMSGSESRRVSLPPVFGGAAACHRSRQMSARAIVPLVCDADEPRASNIATGEWFARTDAGHPPRQMSARADVTFAGEGDGLASEADGPLAGEDEQGCGKTAMDGGLAGSAVAADRGRQMSARFVRISFWAPPAIVVLWRATIRELCLTKGVREEWEAAQIMLDDFESTWDDAAAEKSRRIHKTIDRDRWRCSVPGCSSWENLHAHHIEFRSAGGSDEPENLTTLCAGHHLHGVHGSQEGRLIVRGEAPDRLVWTMGARESGPPALVFEGDRRTHRLKRRSIARGSVSSPKSWQPDLQTAMRMDVPSSDIGRSQRVHDAENTAQVLTRRGEVD